MQMMQKPYLTGTHAHTRGSTADAYTVGLELIIPVGVERAVVAMPTPFGPAKISESGIELWNGTSYIEPDGIVARASPEQLRANQLIRTGADSHGANPSLNNAVVVEVGSGQYYFEARTARSVSQF